MISKCRSLFHWAIGLLICEVLVLGGSLFASTNVLSQSSLDGQSIFNQYCSHCHTVGGGILVGPDLKGVTQLQSQQWLVNFISNPNQVITSGDPTANALVQQYNNIIMPTLGLSNDQILAVISYLGGQPVATMLPTPMATSVTAINTTPNIGPVVATNLTPAAASVTGDPEHGKAIFIDQVHPANAGPACIGCHSIDNIGILGGGALGPNLTQASVKYGEKGLAALLANINFPMMKPVFAGHPLTQTEQADLVAFITSAAGESQTNKEALIVLISLAGFLGVMIVAAFIWRKRLLGVRRKLVEKSRMSN